MIYIIISQQSANILCNSGMDYGTLHALGGKDFSIEIPAEKAQVLFDQVKSTASGLDKTNGAIEYSILEAELGEVCRSEWVDLPKLPGHPARSYISGFGWRVEFIPASEGRPDLTILYGEEENNFLNIAGDHRAVFKKASTFGYEALRQCFFSLLHPVKHQDFLNKLEHAAGLAATIKQAQQ